MKKKNKIELIDGDPILDMGEDMSAGVMVPFCTSYCRTDETGKRSNYNHYKNEDRIKVVPFTTELKDRVMSDLVSLYGGTKLYNKMREFDLLNF